MVGNQSTRQYRFLMGKAGRLLLIALLLLAAACRQDDPSPTENGENGTGNATTTADNPPSAQDTAAVATEIPSPTAVPPTPTPSEPLAALVNGQPIFLADYERELARYEQAQAGVGTDVADNGDAEAARIAGGPGQVL